MINKIRAFIQESRQEFKRVNWPSFQEAMRLTGIVIGISLGVAIFLGVLDFIFSTVLQKFFL